MSELNCTIVTKDGNNLFTLDHIPQIGEVLHYYIFDQKALSEKVFTKDSIEHWKSLDGKYWKVTKVFCEVRNYGSSESCVPFAYVEEVEAQ